MRKRMLFISILGIGILSGCAEGQGEDQIEASSKNEEKVVKEVTLTAEEAEWKLSPEHTFTASTYNGTVPGEQVRVKEGEILKVNFKNDLEESATIHWHGIPVPNSEDGIPGVTQDAVLPGETYTYEFKAEDPGTYWYHTHQDGVRMIDKGLYGSIIVEPEEGIDADRDYTLVLDEWESEALGEGKSGEEAHSTASMEEGHGMMEHDMSSYDVYTINGKTYEANEQLNVKKGEKVRLRFINAGYMPHSMHIPVDYKVTHVDGQKINSPQTEKGSLLEIAPGERYDIEFIANGKKGFTIDRHGDEKATKDMKIDVVYEDGNGQMAKHERTADQVQLTKLGEKKEGPFSLDDSFDLEYDLELGAMMDHNSNEMAWTINDNVYPDTEPLKVDEGDQVKVTLSNNSIDDSIHPMHLHGHFFQVLSKNGEPLEGSPVIKDTLNVKPGETYEVAFTADNPGNWLFHCHDLHHASNGMVTNVLYNDFEPFYKDTGKVDNQPE